MNVMSLTLRGGLALAVLVLTAVNVSAAIVYVDATTTNTQFAPSAGGGAWTTNGADSADGIWRLRPDFGIAPSVTVPPSGSFDRIGGTVFESTGNSNPSDDVPRVVTTVAAPAGLNDVYVYFWTDQSSSPWRIRAGLSDSVDPLPLFIGGGAGSPPPVDTGGRDQDNRVLWRGYVGQVAGASPIAVYIEDAPAANGNERTWYDGVGYELVPEPTSLALLGLGLGLLLIGGRSGRSR
jgi:hypothetical protein